MRIAAFAFGGDVNVVATGPAIGDAEKGKVPSSPSSSSSSDADSLLTVAPPTSAASCSSRFSCSAYKGHLRRSRAGMRVRLHGGTRARAGIREVEGAEDGGDDDGDDDVYKVVTSVASADEVREDARRGAEEAVDESRVVLVAAFSEHRCESGKAAATSGGLTPDGRNRGFTVLSSDIGGKKV